MVGDTFCRRGSESIAWEVVALDEQPLDGATLASQDGTRIAWVDHLLDDDGDPWWRCEARAVPLCP